MNSKLWNTIKINIYLRSHASKWKIIHRIDRLAHNTLTLIDFRLKLKILNICTPKLHSNYYWAMVSPNGFCYLTYILYYIIYIHSFAPGYTYLWISIIYRPGRPDMVILWSHNYVHMWNVFLIIIIIIISGRCSAAAGWAYNGVLMDCQCHALLRDFV